MRQLGVFHVAPHHGARFARAACFSVCLALALSACRNTTGPARVPDLVGPDVRPWTTGAAARNLDSAGHFQLLAPTTPPSSYPITTAAGATALVVAFLRAFAYPEVSIGGALGEHLQQQHGAPIDFSRIRPHSRVYFAISPYDTVPEGVPIFVRKAIGPAFVVHMMQDRELVISTMSSALNTDLWVRPDGRIGMPPVGGGAFRSAGVPTTQHTGMPLSPELAVQMVAAATGRRVREVPELVLPRRSFIGQYARWRLVLDSPATVTIEGRSERRTVSEVYVGLRWGAGPIADWLGVAAPIQPTHDTLIFPQPKTRRDAPDVLDTTVVRVLRPINFDRVAAGP